MNGPLPKVQIFSVGAPRLGATKATRRWYVKWRVDGRDRTRALKTRAEADRFRSTLLIAVQEGQQFDIETGLPGGRHGQRPQPGPHGGRGLGSGCS